MSQFFIDKCKAFIDFMLSQQQWSGLTIDNIDSWLSNFRDLPQDEQIIVYKLLTNIIYFSENDIIDSLKIGVYNCLSYEDILNKQINSNFTMSAHSLKNAHKANIDNACFVPLLDSSSPHESANNICRMLVQQNIISSQNSKFIDQVPEMLKNEKIKNLVIVDDCIGSGDQLRGFWSNTKINVDGVQVSIKELCQNYKLKPNYLTLFGYNDSIKTLQEEFPDLNIVCVRLLNDQHRVFSGTSYIWENNEEKTRAFDLLKSLAQNAGISIYGYKGLDFAFIMHKTIPDWSLPIFWEENSNWKPLLRRKNSNA